MSKGFSFMLVCIVMVVMLVFSVISSSVSGADVRLAKKSLQAQVIYYGLDDNGEQLLFKCSTEASAAYKDAQNYIANKLYNTLPEEYLNLLRPLITQYKSGGPALQLQRGIFFYCFAQRLDKLKISYKLDLTALNKTIISGSDETALTIEKTIKSSVNSGYSLSVILECGYNSTLPALKVTQWKLIAGSANFSDNGNLNVWDGK